MSVEKPTKWLQTSIGSLCNLINGRAFKPKEWSEAGLPIIRIQNLNNPNATYNHYDGELADKHRIENGELLFAWSGTPGTSFGAHVWKGETAALNQHIFKIEFIEALIDKRFLRYAINQTLDELISGAHGGVGLRHVTKGKFEATDVAFPPLAEQKVIADKLDTLLAQVENTNARLERIPQILKRFRQSVLAAAVSGRINGSDISKWDRAQLIDIVTEKPRNGRSPKGVNYETPYRNLTLSATTSGQFLDGNFKYVELDIGDDSYLWVKNGDILIQRANTLDYVGISALYRGPDNAYVYPDLMMKCTTNERAIPEFLHLTLLSEPTRKYFRDNATGTSGNMPKINQKTVSETPISLPPIADQTEIVRRVDQLFAHADRIEQQVNNALARVNNLTQSILAKAFRGELTEQWRKDNPELISGENSAEALLERIKAERAAKKPGVRRTKIRKTEQAAK
ncbi:Type I restriction-modification system, specificity subunit S [Marinobacter nitratireducens]|uniref:Type I restriction-modification system, specificity subunit S n=1 Tax=Marinobacter nitratireducens TaxID=1137280 RepID=A0A072N450_9GAMM|nr:restriction endonuclease subunit S [Marinobacter nitratireducens]KEF32494.1 Type I restriction-modification system, specificity subunit S [Marinobacter nitratireducens]